MSLRSYACTFHPRRTHAAATQALAVLPPLWQPAAMADRMEPIRKTPAEILTDLLDGHEEALRFGGPEKGRKYLLSFIERANSVPNAVKFFLFDLLAEDTFRGGDPEACRFALARAADYLPTAREETPQRFREYAPSIRFFERGIGLAIDDGEFENALSLCDQAIALGLGKAYAAKKASVERMM